MKYVILLNENGGNKILQEFKELKEGFKAFKKMNPQKLKGDQEYELVKYDESNTALDWLDSELRSINKPLGSWLTKKISKTKWNYEWWELADPKHHPSQVEPTSHPVMIMSIKDSLKCRRMYFNDPVVFRPGQDVFYEGKKTHVEVVNPDNTYVIANPDWDWYFEAECVEMGFDYNVPYWITVRYSELTLKAP